MMALTSLRWKKFNSNYPRIFGRPAKPETVTSTVLDSSFGSGACLSGLETTNFGDQIWDVDGFRSLFFFWIKGDFQELSEVP
jgi:hypothetical protein